MNNIEDIYPLSPMHQGLLFHTLLSKKSDMYFQQLICELLGDLDTHVFEAAWQGVLEKYPPLRTFFIWDGVAEPVQIVQRSCDLPIEYFDWQNFSKKDQMEKLQGIIDSDRKRGFELDQPPLMRLTLIQVQEYCYQLVWSSHHLILDGWSTPIVLKDVFTYYDSIKTKSYIPINYPPSYHNYVEWIKNQDLESSKDYWKKNLKGLYKPTQINFKEKNKNMDNAEYSEQNINFDPPLFSGLTSLAQYHKITISSILYAAWAKLINFYSGEDDVIFGVTISGRSIDFENVESIVGVLINTLPLRINLSPNETIGDYFRRLQLSLAEIINYEYTPLIQIQEWSEIKKGQPLFDSIVVISNNNIDSTGWHLQSNIKVREIRSIEKTNYPLTLDISIKNELTLRIEYNTDLFDAETINRMLVHYQTILEGMVANPDQRVEEVPILSEAELQLQLIDWNNSKQEFPQDKCYHELFEAQVKQTPDAIAVSFDDSALSYQELNFRSNQLAHHLQSLGAGPDVVISLLAERGIDLLTAILATFKAGSAYCPLEPLHPQARILQILQQSKSHLVLASKKFETTLSQVVENIPINERPSICYIEDLLQIPQSEDNLSIDVTPRHLAYVIYTSGSTGSPKGAMVEHRGMVNHIYAKIDALQLTQADIIAQTASQCFDISVWQFLSMLVIGGQVRIISDSVTRDPRELLFQIDQGKISILEIVPSLLSAILDILESTSSNQTLTALRWLILTGEALQPELSRRWLNQYPQIPLLNAYGPTECSDDVSHYKIYQAPSEDKIRTLIGRPISNTQLYILDKTLSPVPIGVYGQLYVGGVGVGRGYLGDPVRTSEVFIPDPFSREAGSRLYKTGDLAKYLPDGNLDFLGRIDHQVKIRGFRIELGEIEAVLQKHPGVHECLITTQEDESKNKHLVAYIVPNSKNVNSNELYNYLKKQLPHYMIPADIVFIAAFPITANGKVDRNALPAIIKNKKPPLSENIIPKNLVEEIIIGIWMSVLKTNRIEIHDNFFELGGHSLLAIQVISRIREALKVDISISDLFEYPTIAELENIITNITKSKNTGKFQQIHHTSENLEIPLSYTQQRLWFLYQLDPLSSAYNVPMAFHLKGPIKYKILQESIRIIVQRHEILRTRISYSGGIPRQTFDEDFQIPISIILLESICESTSNFNISAFINNEVQTPFDLSSPPLLRIKLIQIASEEHILIITMPHIVSDGWSMGIFLQELEVIYNSLLFNKQPELSELSIQYSDFSQWQQSQFQAAEFEKQKNYWNNKLSGELPILNFPIDHSRPNIQTFCGAHKSFTLPNRLSTELRQLSRKEDCSLFMTLLTGFVLLLKIYTNQDDFIIGTLISSRNVSVLENLIGPFVNTLALRIDINDNLSFKELLENIRKVAMEAYTNQDVPIDQIINHIGLQRDPSRNPLYQTMFIMENPQTSTPNLFGINFTPLDIEGAGSTLDITLSITDTNNNLQGDFEYNTDLFDAETINRMLVHYQTILEGMVANPDQRVEEVPILSEAELQLQLIDWNNSKQEFPQDKCYHELFEAQVKQTPDAIAVSFDDSALSYQELNFRSNQLAHHLQSLGAGPDVVISLLAERGIDLLTAILATFKAGSAYCPLEPLHPQARILQILQQSKSHLVLASKKFETTLSQVVENIPINERPSICYIEDLLQIPQSEDNLSIDVTPRHLAYVIYTSGSTGSPKGAMVEHRGMVNHIYAKIDALQLTQADIIAQTASQCFDISVWQFLSMLVIGGQVRIISDSVTRDPRELLFQIDQGKISILEIVPSLLSAILDILESTSSNQTLTALRWLILTGEALQPELSRRWLNQYPQIPLLNAYGPTECSDDVSHYKIYQAPSEDKIRTLIGRPISNTQLYILDKTLSPVPIGVYGQLYVGGVGVGRGYLGDPVRTSEVFIPDPFSREAGSRLYKTGDLAKYLPDGNLDFLGRIDHQVKIRGFRIELGEIEAVLQKHPGVHECLITTQEDESKNKHLVAYIVPNSKNVNSNENNNEQIAAWRETFNSNYNENATSDDFRLNTSTWNNSYDNQPFSDDEMEEWASSIANQIIDLNPKRVLEIGCGTGLILFRVAQVSEEYWGTDISEKALNYIQSKLSDQEKQKIHLSQRDANNFHDLDADSFDCVILASVTQYFPSNEYLLQVLENAIRIVKPGGFLFLADIRNLNWLNLYHTSVQLFQSIDSISNKQLNNLIMNRIYKEKELLIDPCFFQKLRQHFSKISNVQVNLKKGEFKNELTKYRYDVILHIRKENPFTTDLLNWENEDLSEEKIRQLLSSTNKKSIGISNIPNAHLYNDAIANDLIKNENEQISASQIRTKISNLQDSGIDPELLQKIAAELSFKFTATLSKFDTDYTFTAIFIKENSQSVLEDITFIDLNQSTVNTEPWSQYTNNPLQVYESDALTPQLISYLHQALPEYMVPSCFVYFDKFPLLSNGKINLEALPKFNRETLLTRDLNEEPRDITEQKLTKIWMDLLSTSYVGKRDNFFEIGGHSLLAARLTAKIEKEFGQKLSLNLIFLNPTIEKLAEILRGKELSNTFSPMIALQVGSTPPPFFCIHAIGGTVFEYRLLSKYMGIDQPFYGIQTLLNSGKTESNLSIEKMASFYIESVLSIQPHGPYNLGGWSLGASIAFEMAHQLSLTGEKVASLILIDGWAPIQKNKPVDPILDENEMITQISSRVNQQENRRNLCNQQNFDNSIKNSEMLTFNNSDSDLLHSGEFIELIYKVKTHYLALQKYLPKYKYNDSIYLFLAEEGINIENPTLGWNELVSGKIHIEKVPGDHYSIFNEPNVQFLARLLKQCLNNIPLN